MSVETGVQELVGSALTYCRPENILSIGIGIGLTVVITCITCVATLYYYQEYALAKKYMGELNLLQKYAEWREKRRL